MDNTFHLFGPSHWVAMLMSAAAAWWLILFYRASSEAGRKRRMDMALAGILIVTVLLDPVLNCVRLWDSPAAEIWAQVKKDSLPMHFCDLVALLLAAALITRRQRLAETGYLWGLSGTMQGLLTPGLKYDWPAPEYFAFFLQHGGVPVVALGLVFGAGLAPLPGALRRSLLWINAYLVVIFAFNFLLDTNYGYLNAKPDQASLLDVLGPWPWYLLAMEGLAVSFFALLLLPFRRRWAGQKPAAPGNPLPASP